MEMFLEILGFALMLVGIGGSVLPLLPGSPLVFFGAVLVAWSRDFTLIGWPTLACLFILMLLTVVSDLLASAAGAKRSGASKLALVASVLGAIFGLFFGIIGVLIGPFIGAVIGEIIHSKNLQKAWDVGVGTWVGLIIGSAIKVGITVTMLAVTVFFYFF